MAYFPDLSPYEYSGKHVGDLNVGWLAFGQPFPTAPPSDALVRSLLRCTERAARLYRGIHTCDLCDPDRAIDVWPLRVGGRRYFLGNGEIVVSAAGGQSYSAPTLVAHYVAHHHYAPPEAFCTAVVAAAARIPELDVQAIEGLRALSPVERFDLCLDAIAASNVTGHPWVTNAFTKLRAARPALDPALLNEFAPAIRALMDATVLPPNPADQPPVWLHDAIRSTAQLITVVPRVASELYDEESLEATAKAIEDILAGPSDISAIMARLTGRGA